MSRPFSLRPLLGLAVLTVLALTLAPAPAVDGASQITLDCAASANGALCVASTQLSGTYSWNIGWGAYGVNGCGASDSFCTVTCFIQGNTSATVTINSPSGTFSASDTFYCQGNP